MTTTDASPNDAKTTVIHHDAESPELSVSATEVKWEKVLWKRQSFPDNYVPDSFLSELDRLPLRRRPGLSSLIIASMPISQHLCAIALFVAVFYRLLSRELGPGQVGWSVVAASLVEWGLSRIGWGKLRRKPSDEGLLPRPTPIRSLLLPPLLLSLLSPVLGTLTSATTNDSIWPLSGGLFFVHLLLADFTTGPDLRTKRMIRRKEAEMRRVKQALDKAGGDGKEQNNHAALEEVREKSLTSSLSLTSALSASIVLASRLQSTEEVFALVLLSVALFGGWPDLAKRVRESGKTFSCLLTLSLILLVVSLLPLTHLEAVLQPTTSVLMMVIALVNIVGPFAFWYAWIWKTQRGGGWDVAVVKVRKDRDG